MGRRLFITDIIHGKLDQKNKQLEVDYAIGRDIRPDDVKKISATLQEWCDSCESVLQTIENQIDRANSAKAMRTKHTEDLEAEVCVFLLSFADHKREMSNFNWDKCLRFSDYKLEENVKNTFK